MQFYLINLHKKAVSLSLGIRIVLFGSDLDLLDMFGNGRGGGVTT